MIIVIASQKGGSGKTTTAYNLAEAIVLAKKRVLIVDADPQGSARLWRSYAEDTAKAPVVVGMGADMHQQIPDLANHYDHTIIDCSPRHGDIMRSALRVADTVVIPVRPTHIDLGALGDMLALIEDAHTIRPEIKVRVMLSQRNARSSIADRVLEALREEGLEVLRAELQYRVAYQESMGSGQGVCSWAPRSKAAKEVRALAKELTGLRLRAA